MVKVNLKEAIDIYSARTGIQISYAELAEAIGVSLQTIESIASRTSYAPSLKTVESICRTLEVDISMLLKLDPPINR